MPSPVGRRVLSCLEALFYASFTSLRCSLHLDTLPVCTLEPMNSNDRFACALVVSGCVLLTVGAPASAAPQSSALDAFSNAVEAMVQQVDLSLYRNRRP